jgi:hypothetical protein
MRNLGARSSSIARLALTMLLVSCASYGPYHANTADKPLNSVRGPADGRYKMAFIEFGDQGSALDESQRAAALSVIHQSERPLLFVYIHGWQNDAVSGDTCRFEHFLDTLSRFPEMREHKINLIGVYIAWRGKDLTIPGLDLLTFWSRKSAGGEVAAQNGCLAAISELALAARAPDKKLHHCVLMGHSFGGLVLGNTISHSILDASSTGERNSSPWDMAVAFNSADDSISTRQLMSELDYLYKYDASRHAYVGRSGGPGKMATIDENRPLLIMLQAQNDSATGGFFPIGTGLANVAGLRYHWTRVPVPGHNGEKVSEKEFETHTPGNSKYLVNYQVVPRGEATPPPGLRGVENRAVEANALHNLHGRIFYTSENNDGHEKKYCRSSIYNPDEIKPAPQNEVWRKWEIVYTGNARIPFWIVRVPKEIISGHGGLWSDNSIALFTALYRLHFPVNAQGVNMLPSTARIPGAPKVENSNKNELAGNGRF